MRMRVVSPRYLGAGKPLEVGPQNNEFGPERVKKLSVDELKSLCSCER